MRDGETGAEDSNKAGTSGDLTYEVLGYRGASLGQEQSNLVRPQSRSCSEPELGTTDHQKLLLT